MQILYTSIHYVDMFNKFQKIGKVPLLNLCTALQFGEIRLLVRKFFLQYTVIAHVKYYIATNTLHCLIHVNVAAGPVEADRGITERCGPCRGRDSGGAGVS